MRQRVWFIIFGAAWCALPLPGCANCSGNLIPGQSGDGNTPRTTAVTASQKGHPHNEAGLDDSIPPVSPPRRPEKTLQQQLPGEAVSESGEFTPAELPPGKRVPELQDPPKALGTQLPMDLPTLPALPQ